MINSNSQETFSSPQLDQGRENDRNRYILLALLLGFFGLTYLTRPIFDYDFFWHLKTGEWIFLNKALPNVDPFSFAPPDIITGREIFILKGYWLSQVLYFIIYENIGWYGFFCLRIILFTFLFFSLYGKGTKINVLDLPISIVFFILLLHMYPIERPQFLSFVFFSSTVKILNEMNNGKNGLNTKNTILLSIIFLAWGNIHGGVIVGQIFLITFITTALYEYYRKRPNFSENFQIKKQLSIFLLAFLSSLINPMGFNINSIIEMVANLAAKGFSFKDEGIYTNIEYYNIYEFLTKQNGTTIYLFLLFTILFFLCLFLNFKNIKSKFYFSITHLGTLCYSILNVRYIPFFIINFFPNLRQILENYRKKTWAVFAAYSIMFICIVFYAKNEKNNFPNLIDNGPIYKEMLPIKAVSYLNSLNFSGNLFNYYQWGGYLIWETGSDIKNYIDGRTLNEAEYSDYLNLISQKNHQTVRSLRKTIFQKYNIRAALIPLWENGQKFNLSVSLYNDPEWKIAYNDDQAVIFIKR